MRTRLLLLVGFFSILGMAALVQGADAVAPRFVPEHKQAVDFWLRSNLERLTEFCRNVHAHPELSGEEKQTSAWVAEELGRAGCKVIANVGGHGVVGILENGPGRVVLVRGDMDALPIVEESGLPYASTVKTKQPDGTEVGVMHACGHDIHSTVLIGTAQALAAIKEKWHGTVVFVGQPAEEKGNGADRMIKDGLYERIPAPAYCIALHVAHDLPVGDVACASGWASANVDSVDITIHGRGGHGARPNTTVDPIVTAAYVITQLQTLVSRRMDPITPAVVTVGSIHGGSKHNVIPDSVKMQLTVRSYADDVRQKLLDGIRQITTETCAAFGCPKPPDIVLDPDFTPACYNDPQLTDAAMQVFRQVFGNDHVGPRPAEMGGEDFGFFPRVAKVPGLQFTLGSIPRDRYTTAREKGESLPSLHSAKYTPDHQLSVEAGVRAMSAITLTLLDQDK
jgi:hippurate hydrolase